MSGAWTCLSNPVHCVTSDALTGLGGSIISALASWVTGDAHTWLTLTGGLLQTTSAPHVLTNFVSSEYQRIALLSPIVMLISTLLSVLSSLWRNGGSSAIVTAVKFIPVGVALTLLGPALARIILQVVDALSSAVSGDVSKQLAQTADQFASTNPTSSLFAVTLACLFAALLLWIELMLRNIVLALLLCSVPLVAASMVWEPARRVGLRVVEAFLAVALSKVVVVLALSLGLAGVASANGASLVIGAATLILAGLSPYLVLRLVPIASHAAVDAVSGVRQGAVRSVAGAANHPVVQAVNGALPAKLPVTPDVPEDLGLAMWPGVPERPLPPFHDGPRPAAPIVPPPIRTGRAVVTYDDMGPVMGWEWDDD